jgi:hypothetical protein
MTTKQAFIFALATASTVAFSNAAAQTYQWRDSNGRTIISDTPPPALKKENVRTMGEASTSPAGAVKSAPTEAPKSMAEKELEFKKRQQENAEKAEKETKEKAAAAAKRDNCQRAKKHLAILESGQRIANIDEKGERRFMDDSERAKELDYARRGMKDSCQ